MAALNTPTGENISDFIDGADDGDIISTEIINELENGDSDLMRKEEPSVLLIRKILRKSRRRFTNWNRKGIPILNFM